MSATAANGAHLLVVDDDQDLLRLLTMRLHAWGYRVSTASSAEEGLARIAVEPPQLVLSDIRLPGKDGCSPRTGRFPTPSMRCRAASSAT